MSKTAIEVITSVRRRRRWTAEEHCNQPRNQKIMCSLGISCDGNRPSVPSGGNAGMHGQKSQVRVLVRDRDGQAVTSLAQ